MSPNPIRIIGPDDQRVQGGLLEVSGQLEMTGLDTSEHKKITVGFPVELKEANITEEIILSYEWLTDFRINVCPWRHGLVAHANGLRAWIPGSKRENARTPSILTPHPSVNTLSSAPDFRKKFSP